MDRIDCLGFEGTLLECSHQIIPSTNSTGACVCSRNAVVRCIEGGKLYTCCCPINITLHFLPCTNSATY